MTTSQRSAKVKYDNCQELEHYRNNRVNAQGARLTTSHRAARGKPKWCSLHNSMTHTDAECQIELAQRDDQYGRYTHAHVLRANTPMYTPTTGEHSARVTKDESDGFAFFVTQASPSIFPLKTHESLANNAPHRKLTRSDPSDSLTKL